MLHTACEYMTRNIIYIFISIVYYTYKKFTIDTLHLFLSLQLIPKSIITIKITIHHCSQYELKLCGAGEQNVVLWTNGEEINWERTI